MQIRLFLYFLLTTLSPSVLGQQRSVQDLCDALSRVSSPDEEIFAEMLLTDEDTARIQAMTSDEVHQWTMRRMYEIHLKMLDSCSSYQLKVFPFFVSPVIDLENVLQASEIGVLERLCWQFWEDHKIRLVLATVRSSAPYDDFQGLAENAIDIWGAPFDKNSARLLVLISTSNRTIVIFGNEKALNEVSREEMDEVFSEVKPTLAAKKYHQAFTKAVECLAKASD